jgi:flagellar biosynthetic protein FliQ
VSKDAVIHLSIQALTLALKVSLPVLAAGLIVGLVISIFQAVTQIQEVTLTFIPKILVAGAVIALAGPWMLDQMVSYAEELYRSIPSMIR